MEELLARFAPWVPWSERSSVLPQLPGVYLLGEFRSGAPPDRPDLRSKVVYIGETCGQSLRSRLGQFQRSGFLGKSGHSGGETFAGIYGAVTDPNWLYVSFMAVDEPEPGASALIRYTERALLWMHVKEHGVYPICNRK